MADRPPLTPLVALELLAEFGGDVTRRGWTYSRLADGNVSAKRHNPLIDEPRFVADGDPDEGITFLTDWTRGDHP